MRTQIGFAGVKIGCIDGGNSVLLQRVHQHCGVNIAGILFTGGKDIRDEHRIRAGKAGHVVVKQQLGAGIGVWLANHEQMMRTGNRIGKRHDGAEFCRIVSLIVIELYAVLNRGQFKSPMCACECIQTCGNLLTGKSHVSADGKNAQRIECVVTSGDVQRDAR